ncbi:MAG: hypothetical protein R3E96_02460 [Planctomycetota bacterium]
MRTLTLISAFAALAPLAYAGDVAITMTGTVTANSYGSGPFAGATSGATAVLSFEVFVPGTDLAVGQLTNYDIDLAKFDLDINGSTGAALAGPTPAQVQNNFPAADGFRINQTNLASGHFFSAGFGAVGTLFSSTDLLQLIGTYDVAANMTSFSYAIQGQGGFLEIFPETLEIAIPSPGTPFCDPPELNSAGQHCTLTASLAGAGGTGMHLEANGGPSSEFGYFVVGTSVNDQECSCNPGVCAWGRGLGIRSAGTT